MVLIRSNVSIYKADSSVFGINSLGTDTLILIYIAIHSTPTRTTVVGESSIVGMQVDDGLFSHL